MSRRSITALLLFGLSALLIGGAFVVYAGRGGLPTLIAAVLLGAAGAGAFVAGVRQIRRSAVTPGTA